MMKSVILVLAIAVGSAVGLSFQGEPKSNDIFAQEDQVKEPPSGSGSGMAWMNRGQKLKKRKDSTVSDSDEDILENERMDVHQWSKSANNPNLNSRHRHQNGRDRNVEVVVNSHLKLGALVEQFVDYFVSSVINPGMKHLRQRRSADDDPEIERAYWLDTAITGMGAVMNREQCRQRVSCNIGKVMKSSVPGSDLVFNLIEKFEVLPENWYKWDKYMAVRDAIATSQDRCAQNYPCDMAKIEEDRSRGEE